MMKIFYVTLKYFVSFICYTLQTKISIIVLKKINKLSLIILHQPCCIVTAIYFKHNVYTVIYSDYGTIVWPVRLFLPSPFLMC